MTGGHPPHGGSLKVWFRLRGCSEPSVRSPACPPIREHPGAPVCASPVDSMKFGMLPLRMRDAPENRDRQCPEPMEVAPRVQLGAHRLLYLYKITSSIPASSVSTPVCISPSVSSTSMPLSMYLPPYPCLYLQPHPPLLRIHPSPTDHQYPHWYL